MIVALASLFTLAQLPRMEPVPDQTSDALAVAQLLDALRAGDDERASTVLASEVTFDGQPGSSQENLERLTAYARPCRLDRIDLVNSPSGSRMPVSVKWQCRYPDPDRHASFWFEGDQINRVRLGAPPTVQLRAPAGD